MQNGSTKFFAAGIAALLLAGCNRDSVKVYHVSDSQSQATAQVQATPQSAPALSANAASQPLPAGHPDIGSANLAAANASSPLSWKTPDGWTEVPPSELRVASFKVNQNGKMVDISVIPLGPMAGTDSANVNRWRGQVGAPAATDDEIQKSAENVEAAGQAAQLYDVVGTNPASGDKSRIIGVIQHRPDATWFYKMTGDGDLTEAQKPAFIEFLKSLKFTDATPQTEMPVGSSPANLPPGHPQIGDMNSAAASTAPISHEGQPNWTVPSDWKEISGGQFLVAKFLINDGAATVNVSASAGDGGGLDANVNRWRGQIGLSQLKDDMEVMHLSPGEIDLSDGKKAWLFDFTGTSAQTGQPTEIVGTMISQPDRTFFYKLMGDPKVVAAQKDAFTKFIQSAKY